MLLNYIKTLYNKDKNCLYEKYIDFVLKNNYIVYYNEQIQFGRIKCNKTRFRQQI